ncbi:MAG: tRNA uridine-5-carboxymethylaminomethyl(34) synthesis enzyme MnmG [Candidatus Omnitrophica bacterium]|nr:tRNA uridine-5-carboxymethylaminomethyl(34) synthesis enzyme MnmG [Candidatus Omnitrophota bacterium]
MKNYDCIVIGGGHAGVEACVASARMGCKTLLVTMFFDTVGAMSCNPAIGGVGKGQLVKEVDALGGVMGLAADFAGIQFRQLNSSKGPAVRSSRCQADRKLYKEYIQRTIRAQENLDVLEGHATEFLVKAGRIYGIKVNDDTEIHAKSVTVTAGTFLDGRMHRGKEITPGGRIGEPNSVKLADSFRALGFEVLHFKTGTPPRLDGRTIDYSHMVIQHSDEQIVPFSFRTASIHKDKPQVPCYITHTNEQTHEIIQANMHLSPMYSGQIQATGVRYCPSIEDKLKKFSDKKSHHVFLEPEGLDTDLIYPNGVSTGLPAEVQEEFIHTIQGLENVKIVQYGYSIEHGVIPPTELKPNLETKKVVGLFLAGQINGTTGYEEAAVQGMIAGINAGLHAKEQEPFILGRDEAYVGVLIDDLVTKGTEEPYRMFTSRVEYRLLVREDNADYRLSKYGYKFGILPEAYFRKVEVKYEKINQEVERLRQTKMYPKGEFDGALEKFGSAGLRQPASLSDVLKRPEMNYEKLMKCCGSAVDMSNEIVEQIEYEIKYEGFIIRQKKEIEKFRHIENIKIPAELNYDEVASLSHEIKQKLKQFKPMTLGQANRISGVTPAAISILMIYLKKLSNQRKNKI